MRNTTIIFVLLCGVISKTAFGQDDNIKHTLTLQDFIDLAISQSPSIKYYQNRNVNAYWSWKNFKAGYMPQLVLSGVIPDYEQGNILVVQSDGSIEYPPIQQLRTSANLRLNQRIPMTGTTVWGGSSLFHVQDFNSDTIKYSGEPFEIGFAQPLFAYNGMKWHTRIAPLYYEESQKQYIENVERVALATTSRFFNYLRIKTNYNLASSNLKNSQDNLKIAEIKKKLGQISENDFSRIRLSVLNAQKSLSRSEMDLKNADFSLKSYIGMDQNKEIDLVIPLEMSLFYIPTDKAVHETLANRKETPEFKRRLIEADRELARAKGNNGLATTLVGSFGLSGRSGESEGIGGVYANTGQKQRMYLSLRIPILDWGESASAVKLAESRRELTIYSVEKSKQDFERQIVVEVEQFNLLKEQLEIANEADAVAENGYKIALKKFQNGEISITELNISLSEREKAKRDYISTIENYWESYYYLRILTLYDFELNQKIVYSNPSLSLR